MLHWDYKNFTADTKSGAVLALGGMTFDLSIEELTSLMWVWLEDDKHIEKRPVWELLAKHPAAGVRLAATKSGLLAEDALKERLTDVSSAVRVEARHRLDGITLGGADRLRHQAEIAHVTFTGKAETSPEPEKTAFEEPCGTLTYAGVTVPVFADDFYNLVWESPGGDPFLDNGTLLEALTKSPAWRAPEIQDMVIRSRFLKETTARRLLAELTDPELRVRLLNNADFDAWKLIPESEVIELVKTRKDAFDGFLMYGRDRDYARRIAAKVRGDIRFELTHCEAWFLDVLTGVREPVRFNAGKERKRRMKNFNRSLKENVINAEKTEFCLSWLGCTERLCVEEAVDLISELELDIAGRRTLFERMAASGERVVRFYARRELLKLKRAGFTPEPSVRAADACREAFVLCGRARYDFDCEELSGRFIRSVFWENRRFKKLLTGWTKDLGYWGVKTLRLLAADNREAAGKTARWLAVDPDEDVADTAQASPVFWNALTVTELKDFVGDDPTRQYRMMVNVTDPRKILALCPAFLQSTDPEIRELASKRLQSPGPLETYGCKKEKSEGEKLSEAYEAEFPRDYS